jgi:predicted nucleic acid-binding protein
MKIDVGAAFVVDTNVAIVANGSSGHVDEQCESACIEALSAVLDRGVVVVDASGHIFNEYLDQLNLGSRGMGGVFLKHVHDHQYSGERVRRVPITPAGDDCGFEELPPNRFDRSDRKFLATAVSGGAEVLNATDSDWAEQRDLTDALGVTVRQLCPQYAVKAETGA